MVFLGVEVVRFLGPEVVVIKHWELRFATMGCNGVKSILRQLYAMDMGMEERRPVVSFNKREVNIIDTYRYQLFSCEIKGQNSVPPSPFTKEDVEPHGWFKIMSHSKFIIGIHRLSKSSTSNQSSSSPKVCGTVVRYSTDKAETNHLCVQTGTLPV